MKVIDPKFHIEWKAGAQPGILDDFAIVKTSNGDPIPDDEPLILFRARDRNAVLMLLEYRRLCVADGCNDFQLDGIDDRIAAFVEFKTAHPERMKQPGITRGL